MIRWAAQPTSVVKDSDRTTIHTPDSFSHSTWWSAKSQAAVEQALEALVAAEAKLSPEERKRQDTDFAGTKHADLLLRSVLFKSRTVKADRGYGIVSATQRKCFLRVPANALVTGDEG